MENLLFLGVPILKHIRVVISSCQLKMIPNHFSTFYTSVKTDLFVYGWLNTVIFNDKMELRAWQ